MKKIFIRLAGDNDFSNTMRGFVGALASRIFSGAYSWKDITKQEIVDLFNEHAYTFYVFEQSNLREPRINLKEYLKIKVNDVYFDDEIDSFTNFNYDGCLAYESFGKKLILEIL